MSDEQEKPEVAADETAPAETEAATE